MFNLLSLESITKQLKNLNPNKAPGNDNKHPFILSQCALSFACPLSIVFNRSLETGGVPDARKEANITPLFNKGSKLLAKNYRPLSLTSILCKIIERLIHKPLSEYNKHKLVTNSQHGFVQEKSCTTNLLET